MTPNPIIKKRETIMLITTIITTNILNVGMARRKRKSLTLIPIPIQILMCSQLFSMS